VKLDRRGKERNARKDRFDSKIFHAFLGFAFLIREWNGENQNAFSGVPLPPPPTSFALLVLPLTRSK